MLAVVGNDAGWTQIAREQVPLFGSSVACDLAVSISCKFHFNLFNEMFSLIIRFTVKEIYIHFIDICYVFFPTEGYGGNLNFEKNEKE